MAAAPKQQERASGVIRQEKLAPLDVRLEKLGLVRDWDFALHLPLRYEDETSVTPIGSLAVNTHAQIEGRVADQRFVRTGRGQQLQAVVEDSTGSITIRFLHYFPSIQKQLAVGSTVRLYGEPREGYYGGLEMVHPRIKSGKAAETELPKALTPVYPAGEGIQQRWLRKRIDRALLDLDLTDLVPEAVRTKFGLPGLREALSYIHTPPSGADVIGLQERSAPAWRRLIFDELLAQQITLRESRAVAFQRTAPPLAGDDAELVGCFLAQLPFNLTNAQRRVTDEILADLAANRPMHRLVQGDVGSGKTVVAALAALRAVASGHQASLMAPTEILAEQHFRKIAAWLEPLGIRTAWLTGRLKTAEKNAALEAVASGEARIVIGTHALIQEGVKFANLGLAIVDEQHRFGVAQRLALRTRPESALVPHLLMLSATPIPRTLAMSYLADLDVSVIDELPPGRTPVVTKTVKTSRKDDVLSVVRSVVAQGRQVYWVCPLIEESDKLDLTPATVCRDDLQQRLPDLTVGLVHGAMPAAEKDAVMQDFVSGLTQILVATTVIEVGVDVPNATLMVIEHAERFGLAQLHQLRGRVGRGAAQSACILLFGEDISPAGWERLKAIRDTTDGFEIARRDLEMRGPGEFLGERQSGTPLLRFADLDRDEALLAAARRTADVWLEKDRDAALRHAARWFKTAGEFLAA
ncbi:ATP-dependent DNA helicase RecG [uncultured Sutterella sp.]|uniref:ATP-dependent DNA helicase RecG n=1 Tax=uncultured Sutterella sp. TaxID=286133 RepID=UPI00266FFE5A|nr:ATP-dependent DNA helicase RecG [uncultured Sutterella sp.]